MDMSELVLLGVVIIAFLLMIFGRKCTVCDSRLTIITSKVEEDSSGFPVGYLTHIVVVYGAERRGLWHQAQPRHAKPNLF